MGAKFMHLAIVNSYLNISTSLFNSNIATLNMAKVKEKSYPDQQ
jgi:hypothetical protein